MTTTNPNPTDNQQKPNPHYDPNLVPAEVGARKQREQEEFLEQPNPEPEQKTSDSIDTREGYTVDKEGKLNNFAIEPEMYVNEPGDLRPKEEALAAEREKEREEVQEVDEQGKLTMEEDRRGEGPGIF